MSSKSELHNDSVAYRRVKGRRWIGVDVWPAGPWGVSVAAQLVTPLREAYPAASDLHARVSQLVQSEADFIVRRRLLNECSSALVASAIRNFKPYPTCVQKPQGFASAGLLTDRTPLEHGAKAESLISLYLDGLYIVKDRLIKATRALNSASLNVLWTDIGVRRAGSRVNDALWHNLLEDFRSVGPVERKAADDYEYACLRLRGTRTHQLHYQVHLEHEPADEYPIVHYVSESVYASTTPEVRFSDRDRTAYSDGMFTLLGWWQQSTLAAMPP